MSPSLLLVLALTVGTAPQDTRLSLVHRAGDQDAARSELQFGARAISGTVTGERHRITATITLSDDGGVTRYERTIRGVKPDRLVGKVVLTLLGEGKGYRLRESGPLGSRTSRIKSARVRAVLDASWPEALVPALLDVDAGRIDVLDLASGKVHSAHVRPREGGARYLDLPGGGPTLHVGPGRGFRAMDLPGAGGARIVLAGAAVPTATLPVSLVEDTVTLADPSKRPATLTRPRDRTEPLGGVVLLGDGDATDRDGNAPGVRSHILRDLAWDLAQAGWVVLRYEPRDPRSPGTDWATLKEDVVAAVQALRGRQDIDADQVSVVGHGQGALLAVDALHGRSDLVNRIAGLAPPARPLRGAMQARLQARLRARGATREAIRAAEEALTKDLDRLLNLPKGATPPPGGAVLRDLMQISPSERYLSCALPLLLVYGEHDAEVPATHRAMIQSAASLRGNGKVTVRVISSADRHFLQTGLQGPSGAGAVDGARRRHPALVEYVRLFLEAGNR